MSEQALKLLQGTLDVLVLKALDDGSAHGYAIVEWIRAITDGRIAIEDGALYNSLHRMEKRRWVESRWGLSDNNRRAKFYRPDAERPEAVAVEHRQLGELRRRRVPGTRRRGNSGGALICAPHDRRRSVVAGAGRDGRASSSFAAPSASRWGRSTPRSATTSIALNAT